MNYRDRSFPNVEVSGMSISQSIEAPITTRDTVSMSGSMSSQHGNAQGRLIDQWQPNASWLTPFFLWFPFLGGFLLCGRRLVNQGWFELVAGAGNGPIVGVKASRNLTNKIFCNGDFTLNFRKNGIIPGIVGSKSHTGWCLIDPFDGKLIYSFLLKHLLYNWTSTPLAIWHIMLDYNRLFRVSLSIALRSSTCYLPVVLGYLIHLYQRAIWKNLPIMSWNWD